MTVTSEQLRHCASEHDPWDGPLALTLRQAADELERYRDALEQIRQWEQYRAAANRSAFSHCWDLANKALGASHDSDACP